MTAVDRPDNRQDELVWVQLPADDVAFLRGFDPDRDRTASRADMVRVIEHLQAGFASGRARAGEQQREQIARWLADHYGDPPVRAMDPWRADAAALLDLLSLLGGPQPDEQPEPCPVHSHGTDGWHCAVTGDHDQHTNAAGDVTW